MQFSSAKYAEGVTLLGEHRFHNGQRPVSRGEALWQNWVTQWQPEPNALREPMPQIGL